MTLSNMLKVKVHDSIVLKITICYICILVFSTYVKQIGLQEQYQPFSIYDIRKIQNVLGI